VLYAAEPFTPDEQAILRRYFTNLDQPVFALVNLPEVVKGALFARYSRSPKSLRRLFLDEFVGELDITGDATIDATVGLERAEELYDRVFMEYGDDSVAQLGGVHLACEQASNLLTKVLERGRLMAYLEQSTRYIAYDVRTEGRYRYWRDPEVMASPLGLRYIGETDRLFDTYASLVPVMQSFFATAFPKDPADSDFVHRMAIKAKALDAVRGILPAAAQSNVGIYGTGQAFEQLLLRMRANPLPEARQYADLMLTELRKVIPSFLKRVDLPDRGGAWSAYLETNRKAMEQVAGDALGDVSSPPVTGTNVALLDWDPEGENKVIAAMLFPYTDLAEATVHARVQAMSNDEKVAVVRAYCGERGNRRHRPGRALERVDYRFEIVSDYGAFRDLQRHRMLTIEWQALSPAHGYVLPESIVEAGVAGAFEDAMARSSTLYGALEEAVGSLQASYAVSLAYRIRYVMQLNARAAMHLIELRSGPQGHPEYRRVAQDMHTLIARDAGHHAIAELMAYADHGSYGLERLDAERRAEERRVTR
jgi:thymidylate synthase ThyX